MYINWEKTLLNKHPTLAVFPPFSQTFLQALVVVFFFGGGRGVEVEGLMLFLIPDIPGCSFNLSFLHESLHGR